VVSCVVELILGNRRERSNPRPTLITPRAGYPARFLKVAVTVKIPANVAAARNDLRVS
jgi:hypothetical protein